MVSRTIAAWASAGVLAAAAAGMLFPRGAAAQDASSQTPASAPQQQAP